ncbi:MAG TPA: hypothetical protein VF458_07360 [Ktedonobacteraceae bacterium]
MMVFSLEWWASYPPNDETSQGDLAGPLLKDNSISGIEHPTDPSAPTRATRKIEVYPFGPGESEISTWYGWSLLS